MNIKAKLASLAAVAIIVGTQYPIASSADQPVLQGGDYIVVFDSQANEQAEAAKLRGQGANVRFTYSSVFKGLAGTFKAAQINALQKNPRVQTIEADGVVTIDTTQYAEPNQPFPSWGLDRIDQTGKVQSTGASYSYTNTGSGVYAYIIDTGILNSHSDFGSRVIPGNTQIADGRGTVDCNGHGTHVAGTVGGTKYGVAKNVTLVPVRVLDCNGSGSTSGVIKGIDWVTGNHVVNKSVANLSLGGSLSSTMNTAIANLVKSGVIVSVAAGNSKQDACRFSPASEPLAITVGATTNLDARASYSNYGTCLDIFAPGTSITSDWSTSTTATNTISGTSMATPHVTGVAALYAETSGSSTPGNFATWLIGASTKNVVTSAGKGSPNRLLFTNL